MPARSPVTTARFALAALAAVLLGGCAAPSTSRPDARDPFEPTNRAIYKFNDRVDKAVVRPTARVYQRVVPQFVRQSVRNVFSNVNDVRVGLNNALQGKFAIAYADFGRVMMNSTLGMLGLFDIASEAGIERHQEDFGQTLGWWGLPDGPFIMLPLFGPSNLRDTAGFFVDRLTDPLTYVEPTRASNQITAGKLVSGRAELLDASKVLDTVALDQYQFVRDAYLQRRRNLVYDGKPPPDKDPIVMPPKEGAPPPKASAVRQKDAAAPPKDVAAPPKDAAAPPKDAAAPPKDGAVPPKDAAAPPKDAAAPPKDPAAPPPETAGSK